MAESFFNASFGLSYGPVVHDLEGWCRYEGNASAIECGFDLAYGETHSAKGATNLAGGTQGEIHRIRADIGEGPLSEDWTAAAVVLPADFLNQRAQADRQLTSGDAGQSADVPGRAANRAITTARIAVHGGTTALLLDSVTESGSYTNLTLSNVHGQVGSGSLQQIRYDLWVPFGGDNERRLRVTRSGGEIPPEVNVSQRKTKANDGFDVEITATETPGLDGHRDRISICRRGLSPDFSAWRATDEDRIPGWGVKVLSQFVSHLSIFRITGPQGQSSDLLRQSGVDKYNRLNGTSFTRPELLSLSLARMGMPGLAETVQGALPG